MQDVDELIAEYEADVADLRDGFETDMDQLQDTEVYDGFTDAHNSVGEARRGSRLRRSRWRGVAARRPAV